MGKCSSGTPAHTFVYRPDPWRHAFTCGTLALGRLAATRRSRVRVRAPKVAVHVDRWKAFSSRRSSVNTIGGVFERYGRPTEIRCEFELRVRLPGRAPYDTTVRQVLGVRRVGLLPPDLRCLKVSPRDPPRAATRYCSPARRLRGSRFGRCKCPLDRPHSSPHRGMTRISLLPGRALHRSRPADTG